MYGLNVCERLYFGNKTTSELGVQSVSGTLLVFKSIAVWPKSQIETPFVWAISCSIFSQLTIVGALSESFISSLVVWSVTENNAFGAEKSKNKKSNGEQSDLCDLEQVTLEPQLQAHHCLTIWLQIWYHSLLWGDSIRKGADLEKQNCLFGDHPAELGK